MVPMHLICHVRRSYPSGYTAGAACVGEVEDAAAEVDADAQIGKS